MDVWRMTVALLRRWYVFLPLLVVTGATVFMVGEGINPEYEVTTTVVLVPGVQPSEFENPYGTIDQTNVVLAVVLDAAGTRQKIADQGLDAEYEVVPRDRSRIMDLTVRNEASEVALATSEAVLAVAREELVERQGAVDIPPPAQIGLQVLQPPAVSDVVMAGKVRSMAVVGLVGGALSVLVTVLFDDLVGLVKRGLRRGRLRGKGRITAVGAAATAEPEPMDPQSHRDHGSKSSTVQNGSVGEHASNSPARQIRQTISDPTHPLAGTRHEP